MLDQLPIGVVILDPSFRYTYVNQRAAELLQRPRGELLDRSLWEVYPSLLGTVAETTFRNTLETRRSESFEFHLEPIQRWFEVVSHPAPEGGIMVFFHDIQQRKMQEIQLREEREASERQRRLYESILSNTPDFAYVWSKDYKFRYGNKALSQLYGMEPEEYIGRGFRDVGYPEWHARMHEREIDEVVRTGQPLRGKIPFYSKGGGGIYDYIFLPVFNAEGEVEAVAGTTRDVTALERVTEALKETDRRKDEFLATLAHELRNPLAPLRNGLDLLADGADPELLEQTRSRMARQVDQLVHLVDDLMDLSRISRGAIELRLDKQDIHQAVEIAVEAVRPVMERMTHRFRVELPEQPLRVEGDTTRLS
ncbi:MAG TPA: PAS domain-containing sensor histidine kinase, partial [Flavobacteriales bacterium]